MISAMVVTLLPICAAFIVSPPSASTIARYNRVLSIVASAEGSYASKRCESKISMHGGKGFGGGEATRDPAPTYIDPSDPKGKQQAIHKAESFAEYLAKRAAVA